MSAHPSSDMSGHAAVDMSSRPPVDMAIPATADMAPRASTDMAYAWDLAGSVVYGAPCKSACDCPAAQVCDSGRCTDGSWCNEGHPATICFQCCGYLRSTNQCSATTGCQEPDGTVVNCANNCAAMTCINPWDCSNSGCGSCDPTSHTCSG